MDKSKEKIDIATSGRRLPYWQKPRSISEAKAKINNATRDVEKTIEDFVYRTGLWFIFVKDHLPHGEFERWVPENTRFTIRTARNYMRYVNECHTAGRIKPYHPNPDFNKSETVAVLETSEESEKAAGEKRPKSARHEPKMAMLWNATECARILLQRFQTLTAGRTSDECDDVRVAFDEMARDLIEEKSESRRPLITEREGQ
jgi:hypothetical protein